MHNKALVIQEKVFYEQLPANVKKRIDDKIIELREADSTELLTYGMETQAKVSEYANMMLTKINSSDKTESIESIMAEVLDVSKPFTTVPEKKNFLQRLFMPKEALPKFDRTVFAGKISTLVDTIESQVGRLIEDNIMYDRYIELLVQNINSISETIFALEKYIEEVQSNPTATEVDEKNDEVESNDEIVEVADWNVSLEPIKSRRNANLLDQLTRRLSLFRISRQESLQVAISAMIIQSNNVELSDRLQTLLVAAVPILQNQILLKASMMDTEKGLDICDKVAESIDTTMKQNAEQLKDLTARIGENSDMPIDTTSVTEMSKSILEIAEEIKKVNSQAKAELGEMEKKLQESDESLAMLFNKLAGN